MGIGNRPYVGTWQIGSQEVVQHTPDALVYINGDTSVPGCPKCAGQIDLQEFITEVTVDAGTEASAASASFTLSIPIHHTDSFARDAKFILRPGLEIHIYMRGYFPVKGLYQNLAEPSVPDSKVLTSQQAADVRAALAAEEIEANTLDGSVEDLKVEAAKAQAGVTVTQEELDAGVEQVPDSRLTVTRNGYLSGVTPDDPAEEENIYRSQLALLASREESLMNATYDRNRLMAITVEVAKATGVPAEVLWGVMQAESGGRFNGLGVGTEYGMAQMSREHFDHMAENRGRDIAHWEHSDGVDSQYSIWSAAYDLQDANDTIDPENFEEKASYWTRFKNLTPAELEIFVEEMNDGANEIAAARDSGQLAGALQEGDAIPPISGTQAVANREAIAKEDILANKQAEQDRLRAAGDPDTIAAGQEDAEAEAAISPVLAAADGPSVLARHGLEGSGVEDVLAYPYYPTFHGVVTSVSHSWSGGINTVTIQCSSMLHFWDYHTLSTNASIFGARAKNSRLKSTLQGNNFTGMHPYQIMYSLHHDMVGAAGGVGYTYNQKTNQTAKSEVLGESLFSLNIRYWKRRFDTEMIKLRMHGATGELFSTAQAAFLGTSSGSNLTKLLRGRFTDPLNTKDKRLAVLMEQAKSVGLQNKRRLEALRQGLSKPTSKNSPQFEINMVEMQAYVKNTSELGSVQLFESTYESKLGVARQVTEITGFEFYQDVDGDFVFKPPFYNLDTSSSRVYRIEDIDIISISFSEKEPEVTYMTIKGSQGKNIEYGVDNEWGHKGQYIDYRLVAKFGWRPGDFEAAYFNDSKSMFFASVNRMDIINAPSNSASVTIPMRPEIRAGYPVYIPYLDCFYYCNSFAHSFSVGGTCTTSMELIAKRSKFYAPGKVGPTAPEGIEAIDLANTILPERPLQVIDNFGRPRLSGFPNVVMALDPDDINEMFFVVGSDLANVGSPTFLKSLLKMARDLGYVSQDSTRNTYRMKVETGVGSDKEQKKAQWVEFFLQDPDNPVQSPLIQNKDKKKKGEVSVSDGPIDIVAAAAKYAERQEEATKRAAKLRAEIVKLDRRILEDERKMSSAKLANHTADKKAKKANDKIYDKHKKSHEKSTKARKLLQDQIDKVEKDYDASLKGTDQTGVSALIQLFRQVGSGFLKSNPDVANLESTVNLLDMLSDKKATFSNGTQPGSYRYYSASHPDPAQQGQALVRYVQEEGGGKQTEKRNPLLDPIWQGYEVDGYVKAPQAPYPGSPKPEAQLAKHRPVRGIRVLTANKTRPKGEIIPTSEIRELSFSVQESSTVRDKPTKEKVTTYSQLTGVVQEAIRKRFTVAAVRAPTMPSGLSPQTPQTLFEKVWNDLSEAVTLAVQVANETLLQPNKKGVITSNVPPEFPALVFPVEIEVGRSRVRTTDNFGLFIFADHKDGVPWGPSGVEGQRMAVGADRSGNGLSKEAFKQINQGRKTWVVRLGRADFKKAQIEQAAGAFNKSLGSFLGVALKGKTKQTSILTSRKDTDIYSPVFPVSDASGYEVIGSYRYGRDISIEPQNVFRGMHFQDVLSLLDKETVTNILNLYVRKRGRLTSVPERDANGKIVRDKKGNPVLRNYSVTNTTGQDAFERQLLDQLRKNLTNKQILDVFGVDADSDSALSQGLSNLIADKLSEGIQKVPVINAAYSLADLKVRQNKRVCSCKAAEAEVLLDAFSEQEFVQFTEPGDRVPSGFGTGTQDQATQYVANLVARSSASWSASQDALRGAVLDKGGSQLISSLKDAASALTEGAEQQRRAAQAVLKAAVQQAEDASEVDL